MDILQSQLVLKSSDLPTDESELGYTNTENTFLLWKNIDIRKIVGENLYNNFSIFSISLKSISNSLNGAVGDATADDLLIHIRLTGLNFQSAGYNHATQNRGNSVYLGFHQFQTAAGVDIPSYREYANPTSVNFHKNSSGNFNIYYENNYLPNPAIATTMIFPDITMIFGITPVDLDNYNINQY